MGPVLVERADWVTARDQNRGIDDCLLSVPLGASGRRRRFAEQSVKGPGASGGSWRCRAKNSFVCAWLPGNGEPRATKTLSYGYSPRAHNPKLGGFPLPAHLNRNAGVTFTSNSVNLNLRRYDTNPRRRICFFFTLIPMPARRPPRFDRQF